jgi:hypothetical protein
MTIMTIMTHFSSYSRLHARAGERDKENHDMLVMLVML